MQVTKNGQLRVKVKHKTETSYYPLTNIGIGDIDESRLSSSYNNRDAPKHLAKDTSGVM